LGSPQKKWKKYKKIQKKYIKRNRKNNRSEKRIAGMPKKYQNWLRRFKNAKRLKFDSESPVDEENSIWGRKVQKQIFMDSIKFYSRFNWIHRGFWLQKIDFVSQFRFLSKEIKVLGSNCIFKELICSNQGLNCIFIEVWWPIRDLIETIQNQGPNQKSR